MIGIGKLEFPKPLVYNDFTFSKLITDRVMGMIQTQLLTLLESFLLVQMRQIGDLYPKTITKFGIWHSNKL